MLLNGLSVSDFMVNTAGFLLNGHLGYYYGLLLLYRNGFVALLPVVLLELPQLQLPLMGGALLLSVTLQSRLLPWRTPSANNVELM